VAPRHLGFDCCFSVKGRRARLSGQGLRQRL
jgi:hypothetical protein